MLHLAVFASLFVRRIQSKKLRGAECLASGTLQASFVQARSRRRIEPKIDLDDRRRLNLTPNMTFCDISTKK